MWNYSFANENGLLCIDDVLFYRQDTSITALLEVQRTLNPLPLELVKLDESTFKQRLQTAFQGQTQTLSTIADDIGEQIDFGDLSRNLPTANDLVESGDDAPVVDLINKVLAQAIRSKVSDIHIEPNESELIVRFRHDGVLNIVLNLPIELASIVISRVKIMSKLDIAETRVPQDGRFTRKLAGRPVDVRISIMPSAEGERIVMRLLDRDANILKIKSLGMPANVEATVLDLVQRPNGIMLTTGPTNSGKTTTLYAALQEINTEDRNIMTIEDPVEYNLAGISQTPVHVKRGMTFDKGLRAILRQDPDIVMVGEIRDLETAKTAIHASQTGHLVLSTLHTNSAVGAIIRLHDMGVEPFLLASSIIAVLAQRLVRGLCVECRIEGEKDAQGQVQEYLTKGCEKCDFQGYKGRIGVYEVLEITSEIKKLVHDNASEQLIIEAARKKNTSLYENGMVLVRLGKTTKREIERVCKGGDDG